MAMAKAMTWHRMVWRGLAWPHGARDGRGLPLAVLFPQPLQHHVQRFVRRASTASDEDRATATTRMMRPATRIVIVINMAIIVVIITIVIVALVIVIIANIAIVYILPFIIILVIVAAIIIVIAVVVVAVALSSSSVRLLSVGARTGGHMG